MKRRTCSSSFEVIAFRENFQPYFIAVTVIGRNELSVSCYVSNKSAFQTLDNLVLFDTNWTVSQKGHTFEN